MDRIHREPVGVGWLKRSEESRKKLLDQLKKMVEEMRRITPPEGVGVAYIDGGSLYDPRLPSKSSRFEPFGTIQDFYKYLRAGLEAHPQHKPETSELIYRQDRPQSAPVFTHGDLRSLNILACGDKIVDIVDWETAG